MLRPDGTRVWGLTSWVSVHRVYRGVVRTKSIGINSSMLPKSEYVNQGLEAKREYLMLLRPREESMKKIKAGEDIRFWDALREEEIVAIVELKS